MEGQNDNQSFNNFVQSNHLIKEKVSMNIDVVQECLQNKFDHNNLTSVELNCVQRLLELNNSLLLK